MQYNIKATRNIYVAVNMTIRVFDHLRAFWTSWFPFWRVPRESSNMRGVQLAAWLLITLDERQFPGLATVMMGIGMNNLDLHYTGRKTVAD